MQTRAHGQEGHFSDEMQDWRPAVGQRVVGLGMVMAELRRNAQLTERVVCDLNAAGAALPFGSNSFGLLTCALSVDYFTRPRAFMAEAARVVRPGGMLCFSFSNRCFPTKVCFPPSFN
eukprot:SAG11_NODE_1970_length_3983_cov_2.766478_2_plen_118_part_00